jgi:DNA-directed RNA polymerase subunit RPC12/RpoP
MKFVPIRTYDNYVPAHIDLGLLKEEGIQGWLKDENSVTVNPVLTNAVGGIKLMVPVEVAQQATDILIREQAAYIATLSCPNCGSNNFGSIDVPSKPSYWLESMMVFFLGKSILGTEKIYYCSNCKTQFKEPVAGASAEVTIPD